MDEQKKAFSPATYSQDMSEIAKHMKQVLYRLDALEARDSVLAEGTLLEAEESPTLERIADELESLNAILERWFRVWYDDR